MKVATRAGIGRCGAERSFEFNGFVTFALVDKRVVDVMALDPPAITVNRKPQIFKRHQSLKPKVFYYLNSAALNRKFEM